jgi:hypothetical protein
MALVTTGEISIGGNATSGSLNRSINIELSRAAGATSNLNESALRTLAGIPTSGSTISLASFYGKSSITISLASITSGEPFEGNALAPGEPCEVSLNFYSDGTWEASLEANGTASGNWATPTTTGVGSSYWIRFTRTFFSGGFGNSATGTTGWLQLNTARGVSVFNSGVDSSVSADYTIEISTNSSGTNIIATASFISLFALLFGV